MMKKASKIQCLPNPFGSPVSTISQCSTFPNVFQYNDRQKETFSDSDDQHYQESIQIIIHKPDTQQLQEQEEIIPMIDSTQGILNLEKQTVKKKQILPLSKASEFKQSLIEELTDKNILQESMVEEFSTKRKRKKIFSNSNKKQDRIYVIKEKHHQQMQVTQQHYHHSIFKRQNKQKIKDSAERDHWQTIECPHAKCMLKSLDIIDKITSHNQNKQADSKLNQTVLLNNIQLDRLECLSLQELINQQNKYRTLTKLDNQVQQLLKKLKGQNIIDTSNLSQLKQLCRHTNIIMKIKQIYVIFKDKLFNLSEKISKILDVQRQEKYQMLKNIKEMVSDLQIQQTSLKSQLYLEENLKDYLFRQRMLLNQAYQWIFNQIRSEQSQLV